LCCSKSNANSGHVKRKSLPKPKVFGSPTTAHHSTDYRPHLTKKGKMLGKIVILSFHNLRLFYCFIYMSHIVFLSRLPLQYYSSKCVFYRPKDEVEPFSPNVQSSLLLEVLGLGDSYL